MDFNKWFFISWKKIILLVVGWFLAVILHNLVYALGIYFGGENFWGPNGDEAFFFIIAIIVIPLYVLLVLVYSIIKWIKKKVKK